MYIYIYIYVYIYIYIHIPVVHFCNRGICLVRFSRLRFTSSFISGQLTRVGWCLYDTGGC